MNLSLYSTDSSHVGDYYVKVEVTFSAFPMTYRNTYDLMVRLKPSCAQDVLTAANWISTSTQTIASYDHVIGYTTDVHTYSPTVINTYQTYCSTIYYFVQEETSSGVWTDYTGALVTHDSSAQTLTVTSSAVSDLSLDQQTMHFRVAAASTATLSLADNPLILDVTVRFVHPCYSAVFSDNGGVPTPIINTAYSAPHPSPIT